MVQTIKCEGYLIVYDFFFQVYKPEYFRLITTKKPLDKSPLLIYLMVFNSDIPQLKFSYKFHSHINFLRADTCFLRKISSF